jgi:hypothetical protein
MIFNMHIRNDYDRWKETPKKRVNTLCGKITVTKYTGIPGITEQPVGLFKDDYGWCLKCCYAFIQKTTGDYNSITNEHLWNLYKNARIVAAMQLKMAETSPK